jgi:hypothetical protein
MSSSSSDNQVVYTVEDWLFGCVNFAVPKSAVDNIFAERSVDGSQKYAKEVNVTVGEGEEPNTIDVRLLKADLLKWIILGAGKVNSTSDSDNGWSHSDGGYTLSKDDKKMLKDEANAIYGELEPESVFGIKRIVVHSMGIMPAKRNTDGTIITDVVRP